MAPSKKILLKVVFDTNVIFNGSSSNLLTKEIIELIEKYSKPADINISWHLPEIVLNERRFQMRKKGAELFPSLEKLEKLLGHNLGITKDIIESRIDGAISKSVTTYKIETEKINTEKVNWEEIMKCAAFRLPPFEDSNKEKGFRDSLILEAVLQLIEKSPTSPSICRILLLTNDKLLIEAFESRTIDKSNVRALSSIEDLESLINILDSQITEKLINSISTQAKELFFTKDSKENLYYKQDISKSILDKFPKELNTIPANADRRENGQWWISNPGFVKKEKQKIFWKTAITIDAKAIATKITYNPPINLFGTQSLGKTTGSAGIYGIGGVLGSAGSSIYGINEPGHFQSALNRTEQPPETFQSSQEVISTGKSKFEIIWSVTLTTKEKLSTPKIEEINFIETIWN